MIQFQCRTIGKVLEGDFRSCVGSAARKSRTVSGMMLEKSRLEELSMELPEKERKELLERIGKRMERDEGEEAVPVELQEDERQKIIAYEMKNASAWVRFLLWLRTLFTGRPRGSLTWTSACAC